MLVMGFGGHSLREASRAGASLDSMERVLRLQRVKAWAVGWGQACLVPDFSAFPWGSSCLIVYNPPTKGHRGPAVLTSFPAPATLMSQSAPPGARCLQPSWTWALPLITLSPVPGLGESSLAFPGLTLSTEPIWVPPPGCLGLEPGYCQPASLGAAMCPSRLELLAPACPIHLLVACTAGLCFKSTLVQPGTLGL